MAAITATNGNQAAHYAVAEQTLTADDTLAFNSAKKQLLILRNDTGGLLTATVDGDGGTTVNAPGLGAVSVAAGYALAVAAGARVAVELSKIGAYCKGVVHVTGGTGLKAQLIEL